VQFFDLSWSQISGFSHFLNVFLYYGGLHFVSHGEHIVFFPSRQAVLKMEGKQSSVFSRSFKHGLPSIADNERSKLKFVPNNERFSFKSCTFFLAF